MSKTDIMEYNLFERVDFFNWFLGLNVFPRRRVANVMNNIIFFFVITNGIIYTVLRMTRAFIDPVGKVFNTVRNLDVIVCLVFYKLNHSKIRLIYNHLGNLINPADLKALKWKFHGVYLVSVLLLISMIPTIIKIATTDLSPNPTDRHLTFDKSYSTSRCSYSKCIRMHLDSSRRVRS